MAEQQPSPIVVNPDAAKAYAMDALDRFAEAAPAAWVVLLMFAAISVLQLTQLFAFLWILERWGKHVRSFILGRREDH